MHAYIIGNVTIDDTIAVTEMPAAGVSLLGQTMSCDLGGKGANQAIIMARSGVPTTLIAAIGNEDRAAMIRHHLDQEPLHSHLVSIAGKSSDFSIVFTTPDGENAIVTTTDAAQNLSFDDAIAPLAGAKAGDVAVLQGNLTDSTTLGVLELARARGMLTAFNPSPIRAFFGQLWPLVDVVFLNESEALALTGTCREDAANILLSAGIRTVVLTLGSEGALLATAELSRLIPAIPCVTIDSTGAGDTFMAVALASAALRETDLDLCALEHAARAAAITVARRGTQSAFPTPLELVDIFRLGR